MSTSAKHQSLRSVSGLFGNPRGRSLAAIVFSTALVALATLYLSSAAMADTTVLVGTFGPGGETLTGGIKSFAVTGGGDTWTQSDFNSDGWSQTITAGVSGLTQDIYGNVYAAVNTGDNATRGIRIYRQTGGASVGYLNSTWGSGNLTGNSPDGLVIGPNGQLYAGIAFGTDNNKLLSFDTTTLSGGQIQTGQGGTDTGLTGLSTPRGMTIASDGNFYIANRGTRQILRWTGSGTTASVLATNNTSVTDYQGVSWDAGNNRLLTRSQTGAVGSLTLAGVGSDSSIRVGATNTGAVGVANVEGQVAFTQGVVGKVATAVPGNTVTQTDRATGLTTPNFMLVLRDTRLWGGGTGDWNTGGNWQQGIDGATGAATFTDGSGATSLPSVLTFTGSAGGTATNDVSGTVNVGGLNFAPGAGAYTLAGSSFTLAPDANIRNLSTNSQTISADIVLAGDQWVQADPGSSLTISGGISGAAALRKLGSGTLTLSGSNSYSGVTSVNAGTLVLGNAGGLAGSTFSGGAGSLSFGSLTAVTFGGLSGSSNLALVNASSAAVALSVGANNASTTYSGTLTGGGSLAKLGAGTLTLSGENDYSGGTTISAGTLTLGNDAALGSGGVSVAGGSLNLGGRTIANAVSISAGVLSGGTIAAAQVAATGGAISAVLSGDGGFAKGGSGTLTLSGNNTYSGGTTISAGTLAFGNLNALGSGTLSFAGNSTLRSAAAGTLANALSIDAGVTATFDSQSNANVLSGAIGGSGGLVKLGAGTLTLSGSNTYTGGTTVSAGILAVSSAAALPTSGTVSVATGSQLRISGDQTFNAPLTLAGEFTGNLGVLVNASGTNTWSGPIGIATPTTRIESAAGTLTISGTITTSGSGNVVFQGNGDTTIDGRVTGSMQPFRGSTGTGILTLTNPANDFTGGLGIGGNATGATLRLGASEVIPHGAMAGNLRFTGGSSASFGILDLGGFSETINGLEDASAGGGIIDNLVGGSSTLTIGANDTTSTFRGLIRNTQGQVAIVKTGAGVLTLSGSNSYTGGTTISGGRLEIAPAGRLAASGPITINGSTADLRYNASTPLTAPLTFTQGMISGTGTIGTAVTVAAGGILAPGNSPGAQAYTSGLTWSPGGSYQWEINDAAGTVGANWDVLNVSGGALDLAGLSSGSRFNLDLITLSGTASGLMANYVDGQSYSFAIATYTSLVLPDGFAGSDLTSLFLLNTGGWLNPLPAPGNFSVVNDADANTINLVIVPEPAGLALAGLGIAAAAWASRRRRS